MLMSFVTSLSISRTTSDSKLAVSLMTACRVTSLMSPHFNGHTHVVKRQDTYLTRSCQVALFLSPPCRRDKDTRESLMLGGSPFAFASGTRRLADLAANFLLTPDSPSELYPASGEGEREGRVTVKLVRAEGR